MVYYQLLVVTVVGTAHHIIKQHEGDKHRYGSWNALCEWYYRYAVKNKIADYLGSKLESYRLTSESNAAQYINNSLTSFRELKTNPREAISETNALSLFLIGIKDPGF